MIINLTRYPATEEEQSAGVVSLHGEDLAVLKGMHTFTEAPSDRDMQIRAAAIAALATKSGFDTAMIGGAPYFMRPLETALQEAGIEPIYAFYGLEWVNEKQADGSVAKRNVFRHKGFVRPFQEG